MRYLVYILLAMGALPASLGAQGPDGASSPSAGYTVAFDNQDIRVVLSALANAAGANITFSNLPEIRTTLQLGTPVPKDQLINVIRDVAESNGLVMTQTGPVVRIVGPGMMPAMAATAAPVKLYTYRLKHGSAAQLAPVLMSLFGGTSLAVPAAPLPPAQQGAVQPQPGQEGVVVGLQGGQGQAHGQGQGQWQAQAQGQGRGQGRGQGQGWGQGPGQGRFGQLMQMLAANATAGESQVRIVAEESTNTLLIRATEQEWQLVQDVLGVIDLRPLQVLIEAMIVEVTRSTDLNIGVDAVVTNRNGQIRNPDIKADLPAFPDPRDFILQLTGGRGTIDIIAALNALASRGNLRVRSLPVIVGQNNKQALLNVGSSRPFVQVSQTVPNDPTGRVETIQYLDVGTKLQITPRINADGYVNLEVAQTANNATNEIQFDAPVLSRREATTQVFLRDGQTTVIGGLADNLRDDVRTGIPILRSLPVIGGLFGSTRQTNIQSELYVFLTPHIISDDADIDRLRDALQKKSDALRTDPVAPMFPSREQSATP